MLPINATFAVGLLVCSMVFSQACRVEAVGDEKATPEFQAISLTPAPGWVSSGVFSLEGTEVLLVDALRRTILRYDLNGNYLGAFPSVQPNKMPIKRLALSGGHYLAQGVKQDESETLYLLSHNFSVLRTVNLAQASSGVLDSFFQWVEVGSDEIIAVADINLADGTSNTKLVHVTVGERFGVRDLGWPEFFGQIKYAYLLGLPLLAGGTGQAFFVHDPPPGKGRMSLFAVEKPEALPNGGYASYLDLLKEPEEEVPPEVRFAALESRSMLSGLHLHEGRLYGLLRDVQQSGQNPHWLLMQLFPPCMASVPVPSHATHMTLVPGNERLGLLEKGPVTGHGMQNISGIKMVEWEALERNLGCR